MPKREDIKTILIVGSGPIVIGQACEFDYSGTQACKALRENGYRVVLVNSNPATIMTDPEIADATYIEPVDWKTLEQIIIQEKPDAILPTMGGQTGLNVSLDLATRGILEKHNVEMIGANKEAIDGTKFGKAGVLKSFKEELENVGTAMENIVVNGFRKMEDALVSFVMTGKLNFRDFANSIISDLTRMFVRYAIVKPLFTSIFPNIDITNAKGNVFDKGNVVPSAMGNVFAKNKIVPYAYGGIVKKPTLFPMANGGIGLMGEAGAEAIMPLKRGRDGKLGVASQGGGIGNISVNVNASGSSVEGDSNQAAQLGKMLGMAVQAELIRQKRPGGLLS